MNTWQQAAEQVLRPLAGGDITDDFPIAFEEVYLYFCSCIPELVKMNIIKESTDMRTDGLTFDYYIGLKPIKVDKKKPGSIYGILPAQPNIVNGRGIPQLYHIENPRLQFIYIEKSQYRTLKKTNMIDLNEDAIPFWIEITEGDYCTQEVQLHIDRTHDNCQGDYEVRMMPGFSLASINPQETLPLPEHLQKRLIEAAYNYFKREDKEPEDTASDNVNQ